MSQTQKLYQSEYVTPYNISQYASSMPSIICDEHNEGSNKNSLILKGRDNNTKNNAYNP